MWLISKSLIQMLRFAEFSVSWLYLMWGLLWCLTFSQAMECFSFICQVMKLGSQKCFFFLDPILYSLQSTWIPREVHPFLLNPNGWFGIDFDVFLLLFLSQAGHISMYALARGKCLNYDDNIKGIRPSIFLLIIRNFKGSRLILMALSINSLFSHSRLIQDSGIRWDANKEVIDRNGS